ncbi:TonB-dependent receptor [Pontibacter sp. 13R65]|uniref:SusC/RagA family TonB-linked outer membrane protein n=1 Tax=Pontibacter sp. 13R65 TaxID=3127458 RepID=UPI00301C1A66
MKNYLLLVLCMFTFQALYAQENISIRGTVTDASNGQPLIGAGVQVKGTTSGGQTDIDGNYTIENVPSNATLVVRYIGYLDQEVAVNNRSVINIALEISASELEQVVVIGYGTQRKRDLTGSITSVSGEEIAKQPNLNPLSSLQGKVAGLTVVNSGRAGASPTIRIRGVNSTNNTNPLYVVDGIFQTNIDYLNPADIESMEVLRDPSSIAIFGLQGGNGVIVVTTKRAARGETRVNFQSTVGVQRVQKKIDVTDAAGFRQLYDQQLFNLGAAPFDYTNYTGNTNWQDLIFQDALITTNNLSISNSGEKTTTMVSLGYNNQEGVLKYDKHERFILRLNQEIRVTDKIKVGADLNGFHYNQQPAAANLNNALWAAPIVPVQTDATTYYAMPSFQRAQVGNPIATLNRNTGNIVDKGYRIVGSVFAEINFLNDFTFRSAGYANLGYNSIRRYTPLPFTEIIVGENGEPNDTFFNPLARTSVGQEQAENRRFQQDHTLTYSKTINEKHFITALTGFTTLFTADSRIEGNRQDTLLNIPRNPSFWYLDIVDQSTPVLTNAGRGSESALMSYFGRINYAYNDRYLLNLTIRRDASSNIAPNNRAGTFGSVGLGWVMSDEAFFENIKGIDFLKLRASWGTVGSALDIRNNIFRPGVTIANRAVFGDNVNTSVAPAYVPDPNLRWEVVRGIDLGLEMRSFNNRLTSEIVFYDRTTKDIITALTLLGTAGDISFRTNLGEISNKGVELSLAWSDNIGSDFFYSFAPNVSYNKNNVESIGPGIDFTIFGNGGVNRTITGESIGHFFGYRQTGIYQTTADLDNMASFPTSQPGDIAYEDVNGDGEITPADRVNLGSPFPTWNFGGSFSAGYKAFDFMVDVQGVAGNKIYTQRRTATFAPLNFETNRLNAWTGAGTTNIEPILDNTRGNNYLMSSYFLEPGDYFRFRNVQVGYTFRPTGASAIGIKQLRLSVSGQNIATFSRTSGYTPEAPLENPISSGADNGIYPLPAVYSFGVNATF